jgi:hypothetical protein
MIELQPYNSLRKDSSTLFQTPFKSLLELECIEQHLLIKMDRIKPNESDFSLNSTNARKENINTIESKVKLRFR